MLIRFRAWRALNPSGGKTTLPSNPPPAFQICVTKGARGQHFINSVSLLHWNPSSLEKLSPRDRGIQLSPPQHLSYLIHRVRRDGCDKSNRKAVCSEQTRPASFASPVPRTALCGLPLVRVGCTHWRYSATMLERTGPGTEVRFTGPAAES